MVEDDFEWDDEKARSNLAKHGVSFHDSRAVFQDAFAIIEVDTGGGYEEERFIITGVAKNRLLCVAYTERSQRIRIISARIATRREQNEYYQNQTSH
jgi:uncharacterized DUF497 family protein